MLSLTEGNGNLWPLTPNKHKYISVGSISQGKKVVNLFFCSVFSFLNVNSRSFQHDPKRRNGFSACSLKKSASQNSPAVPKFKKRGIATSIRFSPTAMISEALSVNWTLAATKTKADCGFSFFFLYILFLPTDKMLKRYIPQPRGEVVVWALSPSGSDLIRPLPFQHSDAAKTVAGAVGETWFLLLSVRGGGRLRTFKKERCQRTR